MKKTFFSTVIFILAFQVANFAQDCFVLLPGVGTSLETSHYNDKKDLESISTLTILNKSKTESGEKLDVKIESKAVKSDSIFKSEFSYLCKDGKLYVDMTSYLSKSLSSYQNMQIVVDAENLELPTKPKAGDILPGGTALATITNNGIPIMKVGITITNRKVEAIETLTTPAGNFKCFKISQETETKFGFVKVKGASTEWYSDGFGVVRSETYNKKGTLISYSELSKVVK